MVKNMERLAFDMFCMMEQDGMMIEVMVDGVSYTLTCSMQGDIIGVVNDVIICGFPLQKKGQ